MQTISTASAGAVPRSSWLLVAGVSAVTLLSAIFEPHEAPVGDFPKQPSRKDGLGTMCTEHWRAYVKGLREARKVTDQAKAISGPEAEAV